ncbi:hypothetical protein EVAR_30555_1 [Eumeta japonica]|uniref:Uncharacterized protein n=1 Tax=Eumeta variegata TaxID=151549 RepID=A0A4C1VN03_EUMVA|nr:hypothetical protein EVAR_30555_1 [Eumeta japonica]
MCRRPLGRNSMSDGEGSGLMEGDWVAELLIHWTKYNNRSVVIILAHRLIEGHVYMFLMYDAEGASIHGMKKLAEASLRAEALRRK